jgi:hypothetical protein
MFFVEYDTCFGRNLLAFKFALEYAAITFITEM